MADDGAKAPETESSSAAPSGGGGSKIVLLLTLLNLGLTGGVAFFTFKQFQAKKHEESLADLDTQGEAGHGAETKEGEHGKPGAAAEKVYGKFVEIRQFTVNLATNSTSAPKFARVDISIEVPDAEVERELNQKLPQVRNAIIDLFNSKRPSDLQPVEGRNALKEEIRISLNNFLTAGKVKGVYFQSFSIGG
jgi:flagellar basal body-associated protein FliL